MKSKGSALSPISKKQVKYRSLVSYITITYTNKAITNNEDGEIEKGLFERAFLATLFRQAAGAAGEGGRKEGRFIQLHFLITQSSAAPLDPLSGVGGLGYSGAQEGEAVSDAAERTDKNPVESVSSDPLLRLEKES